MHRLTLLGGLSIERPGGPPEATVRPRRLALLAIVGAAVPRAVTRDQVLGVLWPESGPEPGRHALSQTLYALRRDLGGVDLIQASGPELRLDSVGVGSDLGDFRAAVVAQDWAAALSAYRGPFLAGFYLTDGAGFDHWVESERSRIEAEAVAAFEQAADAALAAGKFGDAVRLTRRLTQLNPLSGPLATLHLTALAGLGDHAGAMVHAKAHGDLVRRELESEPDPEVLRAAERLKTPARRPAPVERPEAAPPPDPATAARHPRFRLRSIAALFAVVAAGVGALVLWPRAGRTTSEPLRVLAVTEIRDLTGADSAGSGAVLGEILTTSLGRLTNLTVVSSARLLELDGAVGPGGSGAARLAAARRAGATELIDGELLRVADSGQRLEIRRTDAKTGVLRRGYRAIGTDRFALIDSVTMLVARDLELFAPTQSVGEVSSNSPIALQRYEEGIRALYQFDTYAALRFFHEAIEADSTFALASYYGWWSASLVGDPQTATLERLAMRLASKASDRDRLLIRTHIGLDRRSLGGLASADSLLQRYPNDPEALTRAAATFARAGRPINVVANLLNRAISLDSAVGGGRRGPCRTCEALATLVLSYRSADSIKLVDQTIDRWRVMFPDQAAPYRAWATTALAQRRYADLASAQAGLKALRQGSSQAHDRLVEAVFRADPSAVLEACRDGLSGQIDDQEWVRNRWQCGLGLRATGRSLAALALAREGRIPLTDIRRQGVAPDQLLTAILDFEGNRPALAALGFERPAGELVDWSEAGNRAWALTLAAMARVGTRGDTLLARAAIDSIRWYGAQSADAADARLYHFVEGLLAAAGGRHREAMTAYRQAVVSWPLGFTRINLEIARSAMTVGEPAVAIYPLQAALRGGLDDRQVFANRTEIAEALAQAFDGVGQRDSAATYYTIVARALKGADPPHRPRYERARDWLVRAGRSVP